MDAKLYTVLGAMVVLASSTDTSKCESGVERSVVRYRLLPADRSPSSSSQALGLQELAVHSAPPSGGQCAEDRSTSGLRHSQIYYSLLERVLERLETEELAIRGCCHVNYVVIATQLTEHSGRLQSHGFVSERVDARVPGGGKSKGRGLTREINC